jgi:hypothetical protein
MKIYAAISLSLLTAIATLSAADQAKNGNEWLTIISQGHIACTVYRPTIKKLNNTECVAYGFTKNILGTYTIYKMTFECENENLENLAQLETRTYTRGSCRPANRTRQLTYEVAVARLKKLAPPQTSDLFTSYEDFRNAVIAKSVNGWFTFFERDRIAGIAYKCKVEIDTTIMQPSNCNDGACVTNAYLPTFHQGAKIRIYYREIKKDDHPDQVKISCEFEPC